MSKEERKILEFRTDSNALLFSLRIIVKDDPGPGQKEEKPATAKEKGGNGQGNGEKQEHTDGGNYPPMSDAQKRYLFRLLAGQGIEGDAAYEELKKAFDVDNLKKVTKQEASQEIEKRLAAQKGGAANGRV